MLQTQPRRLGTARCSGRPSRTTEGCPGACSMLQLQPCFIQYCSQPRWELHHMHWGEAGLAHLCSRNLSSPIPNPNQTRDLHCARNCDFHPLWLHPATTTLTKAETITVLGRNGGSSSLPLQHFKPSLRPQQLEDSHHTGEKHGPLRVPAPAPGARACLPSGSQPRGSPSSSPAPAHAPLTLSPHPAKAANLKRSEKTEECFPNKRTR